jgi:uncharacterized membrane protein
MLDAMTSRDQPTDATAVPTLAGGGRTLDFALMVFPHVEAAEHAYAHVIDRAAGEPWLNEVAFVEHHAHGRLIVRGTVAGHYVDIDDHGDVIGRRTAQGALTGAAIGLLLGPPGLAVGMTVGGITGGVRESDSAPIHHNALLDELRVEMPEKSSALALMADPRHVDEMVVALEHMKGGELIRHHLNSEQTQTLIAAVADAPARAD